MIARTMVLGSALALVPLSGAVAQDVTFDVPSGAHVVIRNTDGDIHVEAVRGREGRAGFTDEDDARVSVQVSGSSIRIEPTWTDGDDLAVFLPADVQLEIVGVDGDVRIVGFRGDILAEVFDGDVLVDGGAVVSVRSVDGDVTVRDVEGPLSIDVGDGDTTVSGIGGDVVVNGVDGDITVRETDARQVSLQTISGNLWYDGRVYEGGEYRLGTHDGDVTFAVPEGIGASLSVLSYDGELIPSFPLQMRGATGSIAEFTLGNGSARVQLASFDGNIHLIRPGERSPDQ